MTARPDIQRLCRRATASLVVVVVACLLLALPAVAETRIALVVGNGAYQTGALANARRDGELMARTLEGLGFSVVKALDADRQALSRIVLEFGRRLRAAKDPVALFYFAGHGVQAAGQNYLLPVDADITSESEVALVSLNLSEVLVTMGAAQARLSIAILDACRNNPFESTTRSLARGLATVTAPSGMLIAYATAPGDVAQDGEDGHSPYTRALTRSLALPGLAVEDVFKRTREDVMRATASRQVPWEHSSLVGHFVFRAKTGGPATSGRDELPAAMSHRLAELAAWERVRASGDPADFKRHLEQFPGGDFAELASYRLAKLDQAGSGWSWWLTGGLERGQRETASEAYERAMALEVEGGPAGLVQAAELYAQSAEGGLAAAAYRLARLHDRGQGVARNRPRAAMLYRQAADQGHAPAMAALATMYEFGDGLEANLAQALALYRTAADAGDADGLAGLAYLYAEGKGVAVDKAQARLLYAKAAAAGHARAMHNLALMLLAGDGGPRDAEAGLHWLTQAAEQGHPPSKRELASAMDEGRHMRRDPSRAAGLLIEAIRHGDAGARENLLARPWSWSYWTRREIQKALAAQGLYAGRINGVMSDATRVALEQLGR